MPPRRRGVARGIEAEMAVAAEAMRELREAEASLTGAARSEDDDEELGQHQAAAAIDSDVRRHPLPTTTLSVPGVVDLDDDVEAGPLPSDIVLEKTKSQYRVEKEARVAKKRKQSGNSRIGSAAPTTPSTVQRFYQKNAPTINIIVIL
ncbi:hypothetical protein EJB05_19247, partial [Eragrostis curvula]